MQRKYYNNDLQHAREDGIEFIGKAGGLTSGKVQSADTIPQPHPDLDPSTCRAASKGVVETLHASTAAAIDGAVRFDKCRINGGSIWVMSEYVGAKCEGESEGETESNKFRIAGIRWAAVESDEDAAQL